jgi:Carboxypeptidase regulatory-like domain/TonB dependent receptor
MRYFAVILLVCSSATLCARAGTTGGISGIVTELGTSTPIAGVSVTVTSPSQSATAVTDARGHFAFVSLAPDEYTVSLQKNGYAPNSYAGIAVFADAQQTLALNLRVALRTIANVTSTSGSSLVRSGTTADIYSINAAQQARTAVLGGGGALNSAYSAIASVPGAYVPANQNGYLQAVHVRGGDASEVGYEFDGIPVNRAFDNYPSGSLSSLGALELQVYTGATPSNAEAQGLAGFVNQVIKTGTFPGYATLNASAGTPTFYHSFNVEAGGATPDRLFSYYVGIGGYNQDYRYVDQFGGAAVANEFGQQLGQCPSKPTIAALPSCFTSGTPNVGLNGTPGWILGPIGFGTINAANLATRTSIVNFHIGIPHGNDGLRDDVQLLYDNDEIFTTFLSSVNDEGLNNWLATVGSFPPYYLDGYGYRGPIGAFLPSNYLSRVTPYFYPSSPPHAFDGAIPDPYNQRDRGYNGQSIFKAQYQKNFSPSAFMRVYGYSYYSDWIENGPMMSLQPYAYYDSGDYEINSHTRGISANFTDQIDAQNLLELEGTYTTSRGARIYNEQMFQYDHAYGDAFAVLVNRDNPFSGTCYRYYANRTPQTVATTCSDGQAGGVIYGLLPSFLKLSNPAPHGDVNGVACGSGPCAYYVVENGAYGLNNTVTPYFAGYSLTDQWRPNDRLFVNAGLRVDNYSYVGAQTNTGAARDFWFNAFNQDTCYDTQTLTLVDRSALLGRGNWSTNAQQPCSSFGKQYVNANLQNVPGRFDYNIPQPRIGVTYTLSADTVLRASYGRYNEQPSAAYEQYNSLEQNLPDTLAQFYSLGFTSPGHQVAPSISYNSDLSLEHHVHGTDMSFKITPFLRQTQAQIENFYINYTAGITSGLNAGYQTSSGFELAFDKGDFNRNGFAAQLSFAYTYATVKYSVLPNGSSVISPINSTIAQYNAYTSACAPGGNAHGKKQFGEALCGYTTNGQYAAACYTPGGSPDPSCTGRGAVANPYWRSPAFSLDDPSASYLPYSIFPGPIGSGVNAYDYPYVATLLLNYRHDKFTITPSLQFVAGNRYGAPLTTPGIDPAAGCGKPLNGTTAGDPRYPYGAGGRAPFNANNPGCAATLSIPDPYTGQFDGVGAFREPAQLLGHLQLGYEVSPRISISVTLANLLQTCFGGQHTGFTYYWSNQTCLYTSLIGGPYTPPVGNAYNPGANVQTFLRYPYQPYFGTYNDQTSSLNAPFNAYFSIKVKV